MKLLTLPKQSEIKRKWYLLNAEDKILGKVAVKAAVILRGKHKVIYTPHMDTGDGVVVINSSKVKISGRKAQQKSYAKYSGYPGGLHETPYSKMISAKPEKVIRLAVERMLPSSSLAKKMLKRLKVYAGAEYPKDLKVVPSEV